MKNTLSLKQNVNVVRILLQIGLAVTLLYAAVSQFTKPDDWTAYLPSFLPSSIAFTTAVKLMALYELVLALWLLSGRYLKIAGILCALTFGGIVVVNFSQLIITFRDFGLFFMALALVFAAD